MEAYEQYYFYWRRRKVIAAYLLLKRLKRKNNRRFGTCEIFKAKKASGAFHTLVQDMTIKDHNKFRNYHRMSVEDLDIILEKISPLISKSNIYRESISAAEMLSATLRYAKISV